MSADFLSVPTEGMQSTATRRVAEAREAVRLAWEARVAAEDAMWALRRQEAAMDVQREAAALHWEACETLHGRTLALLAALDVAEALGAMPRSPALEVEAALRLDHADRAGAP